jgi:hypothetical protein
LSKLNITRLFPQGRVYPYVLAPAEIMAIHDVLRPASPVEPMQIDEDDYLTEEKQEALVSATLAGIYYAREPSSLGPRLASELDAGDNSTHSDVKRRRVDPD